MRLNIYVCIHILIFKCDTICCLFHLTFWDFDTHLLGLSRRLAGAKLWRPCAKWGDFEGSTQQTTWCLARTNVEIWWFTRNIQKHPKTLKDKLMSSKKDMVFANSGGYLPETRRMHWCLARKTWISPTNANKNHPTVDDLSGTHLNSFS